MRELPTIAAVVFVLLWASAPVRAAPADFSAGGAAERADGADQAAAAASKAVGGDIWEQAIRTYAGVAKKNGYETSVVVQPNAQILMLKLTKFGKTEAGHGLLQKKWDQKDTIDLILGKQAGGVVVQNASRDIQVKPPIGDWIKQQPTNDVPSWVVNPSLASG